MKKTREKGFVFDRPGTFAEAFPEIKEIEIRIEKPDSNRSLYFNTKNPPGDIIECDNPCCRNGGFYIKPTIYDIVSKQETQRTGTCWCKGEESIGRGDTRTCMNRFKYEIRLKYKTS